VGADAQRQHDRRARVPAAIRPPIATGLPSRRCSVRSLTVVRCQVFIAYAQLWVPRKGDSARYVTALPNCAIATWRELMANIFVVFSAMLRIDYPAFQRFLRQFGIVPGLVTHEQALTIFRECLSDKQGLT
jgi:hypothetical protein